MSEPSSPPEVFWTVTVRARGAQEAHPVPDDDPKAREVPLFGQPEPKPAAKHFLARYKAVNRAVLALLEGAEAVEIFRFPPLKMTAKKTTTTTTTEPQ